MTTETAKSLFMQQEFVMHSGGIGKFKIECDALTNADIETLASIVVDMFKGQFNKAVGVPRGGIRLAEAVNKHATPNGKLTLLVDDVLTTGSSMKTFRESLPDELVQGVVIFARGWTPDWIWPIFEMRL